MPTANCRGLPTAMQGTASPKVDAPAGCPSDGEKGGPSAFRRRRAPKIKKCARPIVLPRMYSMPSLQSHSSEAARMHPNKNAMYERGRFSLSEHADGDRRGAGRSRTASRGARADPNGSHRKRGRGSGPSAGARGFSPSASSEILGKRTRTPRKTAAGTQYEDNERPRATDFFLRIGKLPTRRVL